MLCFNLARKYSQKKHNLKLHYTYSNWKKVLFYRFVTCIDLKVIFLEEYSGILNIIVNFVIKNLQ